MKAKTTVNILLGIIAAVIVFHLLVIIKVIPYDIAWGGRLQDDNDMYVFESVSILINLFLGLLLAMKAGYVGISFNRTAVDILLWVFLIIFALNTVGNLFARTYVEKAFSVLTFILAFLLWRILKPKRDARF